MIITTDLQQASGPVAKFSLLPCENISGLIGNYPLEMLWNHAQCCDGFCVAAYGSFFNMCRPMTRCRYV